MPETENQTQTIEEVATPTEAAAVTVEQKTAVQTDIEKIESHIAALKADGEELFVDQIAALEAKRDELVAKVEADAKKVEEDVESFWDKYGAKITEGVKIALLAAIAGKLLGVI